MLRLNATYKGLVTGGVMVLICTYFGLVHDLTNPLMFATYIAYIVGVMWTLVSFSVTSGNDNKFMTLFAEGFKCFVIVTLLMVIFWWIYLKLNPQVIEDGIAAGKKMMQQQGNYTPAEIDAAAIEKRKHALTVLISFNVLKYLILGTLITIFGTVLILQRKKK
jgi:hypothetical protein